MGFQLFINIIIAVTWMLFENSYTLADFFIGYVIGISVVYILIRFKGYEFYLLRVYSFIKLLLLFGRELIRANLMIVKIVLSPKMKIHPGIVAVPTQLKTEAEKALFGVFMTLTPGTLSIEFSRDGHSIFVHALDARDPQKVINSVQKTFEKGILEVTRR